MTPSPLPTAIDLFCGAGGLTSGLESAGWRTVAMLDHDPEAVRTLEATRAKRLPIPGRAGSYLEGTRILLDDVAKVSAADLRPEGAGASWRPDLLAGGPPCQPFSSSGKMLGLDDPRGRLFFDFVRLAKELQPRFILFENVAGIVTAKGPEKKPGEVLALVQREFEGIGYWCRFSLLNAADYGAPQRRVRLFMLATSTEPLPEFPAATHGKDAKPSLFAAAKPWRSLGDLLATRPEPDPADVVRPTPRRAEEMGSLLPGTGLKAGGIVEANRPGGHWGYRQDCFLADLALPSRTVRAASTPDFVRLPDGSLRRLTWQECALLQGFPKGWEFQGPIAAKFRQIGNAVQGDIARALGLTLATAAAAAAVRRLPRPASVPWPASFHRRVRYTQMEEEVNGAHRAAARAMRA